MYPPTTPARRRLLAVIVVAITLAKRALAIYRVIRWWLDRE